ncbi:MAG: hypothetical protein UZ01_02428 [Candidatus Brocadia sinica]|nr:MAG: hypothetical protein UZ01_02428 [Candidatus Brocadia sinica]
MTSMKSFHVNTKSLWLVLEAFIKKGKQWKHYLPLINLVLLIGVIGLTVVCVLFVYYPPENTFTLQKYREEISEKNNPLPSLDVNTKPIDQYELILSNNPFSPNRTAWNPQEVKRDSKHEEEVVQLQPVENQQKPRGIPKKITLRGILILGNTRKALIENPDQKTNQKPFIFIEEGEEIAEYKVKNIEPDQIRLDWYGEEQIVVMRSNIKK